jgi:pimeloyl-ACP methyl ester carboxylesterase
MRTTRLAVPGAELHVDSDGSGEPLVLVHGTGADASTWYETIKAFSPTNEVIAYDRRGYGRSTHPPVKNHRIHARDLVAVLESIGRPAHVVGWSSGGVVALEASLARPELFRTLTVIEPPLHGMRNATPGVLKALFAAKSNQLRGKPEDGAAAFYRWAAGTRDGGNGFDRQPEEARKGLLGYSRIVLAELNPHPSGSLGEHIAYADIAKSSVPITWILGAESIPWYEGLAKRAVQAAPAIRIVRIPGASHLLHIEKPKEFEAAVRQSMAATVAR